MKEELLFAIKHGTESYLSRAPIGHSWVKELTDDAVYTGAEIVPRLIKRFEEYGGPISSALDEFRVISVKLSPTPKYVEA